MMSLLQGFVNFLREFDLMKNLPVVPNFGMAIE